MLARIMIKGIEQAEQTAKKILEHVEAIRQLQKSAGWPGVEVEIEITEKADSCSCRPEES